MTRGNASLVATVDHVVPRNKGGGNSRENTVLACRRCNGIKSDMMPEEWAAFMTAHPKWWLTRAERRKTRRKIVESPPAVPMVLRGGYWVEK